MNVLQSNAVVESASQQLVVDDLEPASICSRKEAAPDLAASSELRLRELRYQCALDEVSQGICFFDGQEQLILCNRRYAEIYRLAPEHVRPGTTLRDIEELRTAAGTSQIETPDDASAPAVLSAKPGARCVRLKDGRMVHIVSQLMPDGGSVSTHEVVSEHLDSAAVADERISLQTLIDCVPDNLWIKDVRSRFVLANKATAIRMGLAGSDDLIGKTDLELCPPETGDQYFLDERRVIESGLPIIDKEEYVVGSSGDKTWISTTKVPLRDARNEIFGVVGVSRDISERKKAETALRRLNRGLQTLSAADAALVRANSEQELLDELCRVVVDVGGYRSAWIGFTDGDEVRTVRRMASAGLCVADVELAHGVSSQGVGPISDAVRTGHTQVNCDVETRSATVPWLAEMVRRGLNSNIALPLRDGAGVFGCLAVYSEHEDAFESEEVVLLEKLAADLSFRIYAQRERAGRERATLALQESLKATVQAVVRAVESRDSYTAGHQRRVAELATAIAREMNLPEHRIEGVYFAGLMHDVGKINTPAEILNKPGRLSQLEYQLIQAHAERGYEIIKGICFPWPVAEIILQHHERLDGSGYPNHLKGDEILLEARIVAVADIMDAMMWHRPYRPARGLESAIAELKAGKGRLYDPCAVDACVDLVRRKGFRLQ